ncbi:hypothetical protein HKD37_03G007215 [Glycine soja]|uniref:Uncharacterized protein n=1 Tax=Glycine soja TaxID=3848 RepID=A0A0B2R524_GLYSO|nr:hypothetical protein JHK87_006663 [Glycine soja]KAG5054506.1 hypothetical protein JHK85_007016 [Glycine max]KAG5071603.1 hypothetical protein JHK86_006814 [Glycine max]KHN28725.1 hypothetical protein glysoja_049022 [Glycine soja]
MEYSLSYYHFQNQLISPASHLPFYIDVIETKWEHDDMLHMDHFSEFLCCCRILDVQELGFVSFTFSFHGTRLRCPIVASRCPCLRGLSKEEELGLSGSTWMDQSLEQGVRDFKKSLVPSIGIKADGSTWCPAPTSKMMMVEIPCIESLPRGRSRQHVPWVERRCNI